MSAYEHGNFSNRFGRASGWGTNSYFDENELAAMKNLNYDWLKEGMETGRRYATFLKCSGGSDKATYFAGAGYYTQKPNLGSQDYNKWSSEQV